MKKIIKNNFATKSDVKELKTDLKKDSNIIKKNVNVLKLDANVFKKNIDVIKKEISEIKNLIGDLGNYIRSDGAKKDDFVKLRNELKSDVAGFKDEIIHDYVKVQDDFVVVKGWSDKIDNHEERITKLENVQTA